MNNEDVCRTALATPGLLIKEGGGIDTGALHAIRSSQETRHRQQPEAGRAGTAEGHRWNGRSVNFF